MADYDIAAVTRRAVYTGSAGTGPYAFTFACLATSDIAVYKDTTLLTETSDYTVTLSASTGTGSITLGSAANSDNTITLVGARDLARTTDFVTAGSLTASALNTDFDSLVIFAQQLSEENSRNLKAPVTEGISGTTDMTIPAKATRASKILEFDSDGNPAVSLTATGLSTLAGITGNITTVAGIAANVTTVAGISANVTTCAGKSSEITSVAAKASLLTADFVSDLNTLATSAIITDLDILGTADVVADLALLATSDIVSDINTLATSDVISDLNTLATSDIVTDLNLLATSANVTNMATLGASGVVANIATVAGISANTTTVAGIASDVTTVAGISANTTTVAGIDSNVTTVAGISANVTTVAGVAANVTTVAGVSANVTTVATNIANVNTTATNIAGVNSFAERYRVGSSDPTSSLDEGDLFYNSSDNEVKYYNGSAWASITAGIGNVVEDTTPQLGGNLDTQSFTVDGRDVSTDGTKLDGIATSATANPNAIDNVVEDTTPQLGGTLDANGNTIDMDGNELILDADADTSITADTDDRIDLRVGGTDRAYITANTIGGIINRMNAKPLIINGNMAVNQRGDVTAGTSIGFFALDRWRFDLRGGFNINVSQSTDVPSGYGFGNSIKLDCNVEDTSPDANGLLLFQQMFEGQDLQLLNYGTSSAQKLTIAFWVKCTKTGTFQVNLRDEDSRHIGQLVTINSANTWEKKVFSFDGDTAGAIANSNASSIRLQIFLDAGSDNSGGGVPSSWAAVNESKSFNGNLAFGQANANEIFFTGLQMEVGEYDSTTIPPFQHESFGDSLMRCYRYFQSTVGSNMMLAIASSNNNLQCGSTGYKTSLRATPTVVLYNGSEANKVRSSGGGNITLSSPSINGSKHGINNCSVSNTPFTGNDHYQMCYTASAEL